MLQWHLIVNDLKLGKMGYPNMKCMYITIWVHHMQVDELFDYLTDRIDMAPPFWNNHEDCPYSVTGGYIAVNVDYNQFSKLRSMEDWDKMDFKKPDTKSSWSNSWESDWESSNIDFPDWEDFIDED